MYGPSGKTPMVSESVEELVEKDYGTSYWR